MLPVIVHEYEKTAVCAIERILHLPLAPFVEFCVPTRLNVRVCRARRCDEKRMHATCIEQVIGRLPVNVKRFFGWCLTGPVEACGRRVRSQPVGRRVIGVKELAKLAQKFWRALTSLRGDLGESSDSRRSAASVLSERGRTERAILARSHVATPVGAYRVALAVHGRSSMTCGLNGPAGQYLRETYPTRRGWVTL